MAIFAGTWVDDTGHPWDPDAKVLQTWTGGGAVCVRRRRLVNHPSKVPFIAAARYAADRWHNALAGADRDLWDADGPNGVPRRGTLDRTAVNGFVMFNAFDFVQLYADPPSDVDAPGSPAVDFLTTSIDAVTLGAQTVTFTATLQFEIPLCTLARLATFQINPAAVLRANPWKATRLIDLADAVDLDPASYTPTVPLAWPVASGDIVRLYWRGRVASWWTYHADDQMVA